MQTTNGFLALSQSLSWMLPADKWDVSSVSLWMFLAFNTHSHVKEAIFTVTVITIYRLPSVIFVELQTEIYVA